MEASSPRTEACRRALLSRRQGKARTPCEKRSRRRARWWPCAEPRCSAGTTLALAACSCACGVGLSCALERARGMRCHRCTRAKSPDRKHERTKVCRGFQGTRALIAPLCALDATSLCTFVCTQSTSLCTRGHLFVHCTMCAQRAPLCQPLCALLCALHSTFLSTSVSTSLCTANTHCSTRGFRT